MKRGGQPFKEFKKKKSYRIIWKKKKLDFLLILVKGSLPNFRNKSIRRQVIEIFKRSIDYEKNMLVLRNFVFFRPVRLRKSKSNKPEVHIFLANISQEFSLLTFFLLIFIFSFSRKALKDKLILENPFFICRVSLAYSKAFSRIVLK